MNRQNPTIIPDFLDTATAGVSGMAMDRGAAEPAEILHDGMALDADARRASSIEVDPTTLAVVEERFDAARSSLSARCGVTLSGREGAGFIRYSDGGFYGPHRDQGHDPQWPAAAQRRIAVVVFLNSGVFTGGELVIYPEPPAENLVTRSRLRRARGCSSRLTPPGCTKSAPSRAASATSSSIGFTDSAYFTSRSSTSNSSVALGGMTPPAPRAP